MGLSRRQHEGLREAVRWLGAHPPVTPERIEEAARRFDLGPADEEFLLREFPLSGFDDDAQH